MKADVYVKAPTYGAGAVLTVQERQGGVTTTVARQILDRDDVAELIEQLQAALGPHEPVCIHCLQTVRECQRQDGARALAEVTASARLAQSDRAAEGPDLPR